MLLHVIQLLVALNLKIDCNPKISVSINSAGYLELRIEWVSERWCFLYYIDLESISDSLTADDEVKMIQAAIDIANNELIARKSGFSTAGNQWS